MIICFDHISSIFYRNLIDRNCNEFNGSTVKRLRRTSVKHHYGELGLYNGFPTVVGGLDAKGAVETLTETGWILVTPHPRLMREENACEIKILDFLENLTLSDFHQP